MLTFDQFVELVINPQVLARRIDNDQGQLDVVKALANDSLFVVVGPGPGKTTALSLRVLRLILVDEMPPSSILATTFTRRAAAELRSRILGWGDRLRQAAIAKGAPHREQLEHLDINQVITGTLDAV